jgi:hypothetical protein
MAGKGTYINSNYINYRHFANMKGKIYGNRLPRGTQVENIGNHWAKLLI